MHTEPSHLTRPASDPVLREKKPKENLKQRAYLNSVTSMLDYGATQVVGFVVNPFLVSGVGSVLYGVWQMLGQMTGYASLADTKAAQVLKWSIAKKRDVVSEDELRSYVTSALAVTACILPLVLLLGGFLAWYAPQITGVSEEYVSVVRLTAAILIGALVINKVFTVFESVLRGMNLGYKRMGLRAVIIILGGGLKITALTLGYGLIGLAVVQVIVALITGLTLFYIVRKSIGWFGLGKTNSSEVFRFGKLSSWYMGGGFAKMLLLNSDKIVLGVIAGPVLVATYALTKFSSLTIQGVITNVVHGMKPGIGTIIGKKEYDRVLSVRSQIMTLTWLFSTVFGISIFLFNESFIGLWVGHEYFAGRTVNVLIVLAVIQYIFIQNDEGLISLTLNIRMQVYLVFIAAVLTIALSYFLIDQFGILGLCISIIAGRLVLSVGLPMIVKKNLESDTIVNLRNMIRPLTVSMLLLALSYLLSDIVYTDSWLHLIPGIFVTLTATIIICWFVGLGSFQRASIMNVIKNIKMFKTD